MLKHLNKILLVVSLFLCIGSFAFAQENQLPISADSDQNQLIQNDVRINDSDINPINTQNIKKDVIPNTKNEGKKVIEYFLRAMGFVLICAILLYVVLLLVKRYNSSTFSAEENDRFEELDLTSSTTKEEALKSFLDKSSF